MAGRKRSSDGPAAAAKITKYFCSEAVSTGSGVSEGGANSLLQPLPRPLPLAPVMRPVVSQCL